MKILVMILLILQLQFVPATLYSTADNVAVFETATGDLYEVCVDDEELPVGEYLLIFRGEEVIGFEPIMARTLF